MFAASFGGTAIRLHQWRQQVAISLSAEQQAQAESFILAWQHLELAGSNFLRPLTLPKAAYQLLLIDSHCNDALLGEMLRQAAEFSEPMLCLAANTRADQQRLMQCQHYVDVTPSLSSLQGRLTFQPACHTARLMQMASRVFCSRSWLGLEALLWQRPLHCMQDSPYVNCELSQGIFSDQISPKVSVASFMHHAVLAGKQAPHPERQEPAELIELLQWAALQQRMRLSLPEQLFAFGFSRFWRKTLQRFVQGSEITFLNNENQLPKQGTVLCWGRRALPSIHAGLSLVRLEDGFIRSVGLGAQFAEPMSWIIDQQGLYFDATQPSDLEVMLQTMQLTSMQRQRAEALQQRICQQGITKYNVGQQLWQPGCSTKRLILVAGQVETDASIEYGAHRIRSNIELLQQVRQDNPDAWVIYKPHPDVHSGARAAGQNEQQAEQYCDELVVDASMSVLLGVVDEVHIITSLTGFEALLRGKKVVCYGWPFYAGWGLTRDIAPQPRRQRQLDLTTLVYATLIAYPRYISLVTGGYSTPEQVLTELEQLRNQPLTLWTKCQLFCRKGVRVVLNALFGKK